MTRGFKDGQFIAMDRDPFYCGPSKQVKAYCDAFWGKATKLFDSHNNYKIFPNLFVSAHCTESATHNFYTNCSHLFSYNDKRSCQCLVHTKCFCYA